MQLEENGRSSINEDDYIEGSPELIVEVAASSASYDLHDKLRVYRRNGGQEYMVWRTYSQQIDWFYLQLEEYQSLTADESGILRSRALVLTCGVLAALLGNKFLQPLITFLKSIPPIG